MRLVSHSFEHICLREGGKSVRSLGKAGVIRMRDEVGVGPWLQAPGQKCACTGDTEKWPPYHLKRGSGS